MKTKNNLTLCSYYIFSFRPLSIKLYTGLSKKDIERLNKKLKYDLNSNSFWINFSVQLNDIVLNPKNPEDELKSLFLKNHKQYKKWTKRYLT